MSSPSGRHISTKDISGDDVDDSEVVQREDGAIDIRSEASAFKMSKSAKSQRRQKSKREGSRSARRSLSQRQRSASSATRNLRIKHNFTDNRRY